MNYFMNAKVQTLHAYLTIGNWLFDRTFDVHIFFFRFSFSRFCSCHFVNIYLIWWWVQCCCIGQNSIHWRSNRIAWMDQKKKCGTCRFLLPHRRSCVIWRLCVHWMKSHICTSFFRCSNSSATNQFCFFHSFLLVSKIIPFVRTLRSVFCFLFSFFRESKHGEHTFYTILAWLLEPPKIN